MIEALDETIRQLLIKELPVKDSEVDIKFDQPKREWSARISKPTVNLFLYDVRENVMLRENQWEQIHSGTRMATLKRSPVRVDCFYMLTTWAADPEDEHRLLSRSILTLFRFPVLPEDRLIGPLRNPIFEIQARLAVHDRLTNPAEVWSSLDNEIRPSIPYIVTLALDPWTEVTGPLVRTLIFRTGQTITLPKLQELKAVASEITYIGGTVVKKTADHAPLVGLNVAIKGTGLMDTTDEKGQYTLGGLQNGEYTLVVWPVDGLPVEKKIAVPALDGNYDVEL
jgi:hypothetical protein